MDHILLSTHLLRPFTYLQALWRTGYCTADDPGSRTSRISSEPHYFSLPANGLLQDEYWSYVEFRGHIYRLSWIGEPEWPELDDFPTTGFKCEQVGLSQAAAQTWENSTFLTYGADSCIREDTRGDCDQFCILKLAHPNHTSRQRLEHEFKMLQRMSQYPLPLPRFCPRPLEDGDGIYGFRMERLYPLPFPTPPRYYSAVEAALPRVHNAGFVLGDLHPGNVMLDGQDNVVFIDLAYAGTIGDAIPSHAHGFMLPESGDPVFDPEKDLQRLAFFT